jgi:ligand-binding sensor domain-containing protein
MALRQTRDGYLWMTTRAGLVRVAQAFLPVFGFFRSLLESSRGARATVFVGDL